MFNLMKADLYKLRKSFVVKIVLAITTLCAAAMSWMAYSISQGKIDANMTGIGFMFSDINVMSIVGAVIAGLFICGDFDNKTIHHAISTGASRWSIVVSKATAFFIGVLLLLLPYAIITGIALGTGSKFEMGSVAIGFLNILTSHSGASLSVTDVLKLIYTSLTLVIVYMAQLSICVPLAFVLRKPVLVIAIYYGFSIFSAQLIRLSASSPVFDRIFSFTPYGGNYAFITMDSGVGDIMKAIAVSILFILLMLIIAYSAFRRSEFK